MPQQAASRSGGACLIHAFGAKAVKVLRGSWTESL
jgi:hypothetical protein